ncbi:hypothetical protein F4774DRAFT_210332 [Daldinia eschscholtzii]|nr:hypothetical protein F4774DRAFT_210332 [Daldinia eschscholtzii]
MLRISCVWTIRSEMIYRDQERLRRYIKYIYYEPSRPQERKSMIYNHRLLSLYRHHHLLLSPIFYSAFPRRKTSIMDTRAWLDPKPHSVEGHTKRCVLFFEDGLIWGPAHCHPNTVQLKEALEAADSRFEMYINDRPKSIEGHTAYISVSAGGKVYLDQLPTHDNMSGLCKAVHDAIHKAK